VSETSDLLIVGGGPAGLAAARSYRDAGGGGPVAIIADEQRMPYSRPPLTKDLLTGMADESSLPIEPETWLSEHDVSLIGGRAVALDPDARRVTLSGGRQLEYARCLLATGAEPTRLPVPGADDPAVRVLRTLDQLRELLTRLRPPEPVVVIGSGFIGCEIAASLRTRGHAVTVISDEPAPNRARLDAEAAGIIAGWLRADGVTLHLGDAVQRIERAGDTLTVVTETARSSASLVVMATGVAPRSELATAAGIELADGAIPVDAGMRTATPAVLAAGDVCRAENVAAGRPLRVEHWGEALEQGRVAGRTAAGEEATWDAVPGFWSTIGGRTLKYVAWGDGFDSAHLAAAEDGSFVVSYVRADTLVGVLAHRDDDAYDTGRDAIARGARWPS
jgi:3-phenylpropionate/trans-cinnamate dioxygenase ferredoxin reductase subunit